MKRKNLIKSTRTHCETKMINKCLFLRKLSGSVQKYFFLSITDKRQIRSGPQSNKESNYFFIFVWFCLRLESIVVLLIKINQLYKSGNIGVEVFTAVN